MSETAPRPLKLGLTGSIGMGKSTVAAMFAGHGVPVFDADFEVRAMQGPNGELLPAIEAEFPGSTDGSGVKREQLGAQVFGDKEALARLEAIIHPVLAQKRAAFLAANDAAQMVLFDIPLLFEKGHHKKEGADRLDQILVVSAPADIQRARVLAREGMTEEKFEHILTLQMPDSQKVLLADHIIKNNGSLADLEKEVKNIIANLII